MRSLGKAKKMKVAYVIVKQRRLSIQEENL
jgi:hypothetical protein